MTKDTSGSHPCESEVLKEQDEGGMTLCCLQALQKPDRYSMDEASVMP